MRRRRNTWIREVVCMEIEGLSRSLKLSEKCLQLLAKL